MTINNRGLSGQPVLPYTDYRAYAGETVFIDLAFLDHYGQPAIPNSLTWQVDDLTNATPIIAPTVINTISDSNYTLVIPGDQLQLTHYWQGSEIFQILMTVVLPDFSIVKGVFVLEVLAIQTPYMA